jgi:beta-glucosidase
MDSIPVMTSKKDTPSLDVEDLLSKLQLDEKIALLSGELPGWWEPDLLAHDWFPLGTDFWHIASIPRLNIPSIRMSDGPNGVRGTKFFNGVPGGLQLKPA